MSDASPILNRRRLRFSLRTLLLFVLLSASAGTLWWNWGPWRLAFRVEEPGTISSINFSDDDRFVMFHYVEPHDPNTRGRLNCLDIRRVDSGERHALLMNPVGTSADVKGQWAILHAENWWGQAPRAAVIRLYDWRGVREFDSNDKFMRHDDIPTHAHLDKNHVLVPFGEQTVLYKLPAFEQESWPPDAKARFIGDGWLAVGAEPGYEETMLRELATGRVLKAPEGTKNWEITVRSRCILFQKGESEFVVLNTQTGTTNKGNANVLDLSPDGKYILAHAFGSNTVELRETENSNCVMKIENCDLALFSPDGRFVLDEGESRVYDVQKRMFLWQSEGWLQAAGGGEFVTLGHSLRDAQNGKKLLDLQSWRYRGEFSGYPIRFWVAHRSRAFAIGTEERIAGAQEGSPERRRASVWRLHRPLEWWGVANLPEFWLTAVLAGVFLWSVSRGWRRAS